MTDNCTSYYFIKHFITICQAAIFIGNYTNAQDPCTTHLIINDVTMNTDYIQGPHDSLRYGDFIDNYKWYRYTGTPYGLLASASPQGTQCLSENQVWSNDPIPGIGCKELIHFCVKDISKPCLQKGQMQAKNCGTFVVYQLSKPPGSKARFCFEGVSKMSPKPTQKPCISIVSMSSISTSLIAIPSTIALTTRIAIDSTPSSATVKLASQLSTNTTKDPTTTATSHSTKITLSSTTPTPLQTPNAVPMSSSRLPLTLQTTNISTAGVPSTVYVMVTKETPKASVTSATKAEASKNGLNATSNTTGLIAGIVVCSIVLIGSLIFIVWKLTRRKICVVPQSRNMESIPLKNAKPKIDVHRL